MSGPIAGSLICFSHEFAGAHLLEYSRKADRTIAFDTSNEYFRSVSHEVHRDVGVKSEDLNSNVSVPLIRRSSQGMTDSMSETAAGTCS